MSPGLPVPTHAVFQASQLPVPTPECKLKTEKKKIPRCGRKERMQKAQLTGSELPGMPTKGTIRQEILLRKLHWIDLLFISAELAQESCLLNCAPSQVMGGFF